MAEKVKTTLELAEATIGRALVTERRGDTKEAVPIYEEGIELLTKHKNTLLAATKNELVRINTDDTNKSYQQIFAPYLQRCAFVELFDCFDRLPQIRLLHQFMECLIKSKVSALYIETKRQPGKVMEELAKCKDGVQGFLKVFITYCHSNPRTQERHIIFHQMPTVKEEAMPNRRDDDSPARWIVCGSEGIDYFQRVEWYHPGLSDLSLRKCKSCYFDVSYRRTGDSERAYYQELQGTFDKFLKQTSEIQERQIMSEDGRKSILQDIQNLMKTTANTQIQCQYYRRILVCLKDLAMREIQQARTWALNAKLHVAVARAPEQVIPKVEYKGAVKVEVDADSDVPSLTKEAPAGGLGKRPNQLTSWDSEGDEYDDEIFNSKRSK